MSYVILPRDVIGEVMRGERTWLPVTYPTEVGATIAVKVARSRKPTCLLIVTACELDPEGYTLTVRLKPLEEKPVFLMAGSPASGGKARLMSARKRKPGRAKIPGGALTDLEASGYTHSPARGIRDAGEPVDVAGLDLRWQFRSERTYTRALHDRDEQRRAARELLSIEQRMGEARRAARLNYVDVSPEIALVRKFIRQGRSEDSILHRLKVAERIAHRDAA